MKGNVLLLSAGRRVELSRALRSAAHARGSLLFTADAEPRLSAACQDNTASIRLPRVTDSSYVEDLAEVCRLNEIRLVIPTIDTELAVLAQERLAFERLGVSVVVSDACLIAVTRDKRQTPEFFARFGIASPEILHEGQISFPAIAKPFDGSLSRNITVLTTEADFTPAVRGTPNVMYMRYLDPRDHEEYTCDAYYNRAGELRCVVPRHRLEVRGGEISKGVTRRNGLVGLFFEKLHHIPGARGCLTFQFIVNKLTQAASLIEVNARFGGGFPMSLAAGADYPSWLVSEYLFEEEVQVFHDWTADLVALRYDVQVLRRES